MGGRGQQQRALPSPPLAEQSSEQSTDLSYTNHKSVSHVSDEAVHVDPKVAERQSRAQR